jgi:deoxyribonuclease V
MNADFAGALASCLAHVGRGRVATCGAIARALGDVRAARAVATWIADHPETPRGYRVVRADGRPVLATAWDELKKERVKSIRGRANPKRILDALEPIGFLTALREEQIQLSERIVEVDMLERLGRIAGVDAAYDGDTMCVVAACLDADTRTPIEIARVQRMATFPYIPTYLAYREFAGIEAAVRQLAHRPDLLLVDGHGRLHPSLFGIACYVGERLGLPTIGVAKHRLVGRVNVKHRAIHDALPMEFGEKVRGYAWRPPGRGRPIFVSVGNRISLERALAVVRDSTISGYPEPLKLADRLCREMKRNEKRERGATQ